MQSNDPCGDEVNIYSYKLLVLFTSVLLLPGAISIAAKTETHVAPEATIEAETSSETKTPVEISPADKTMAYKTPYAYKASNHCEGTAEGDYFGIKVCAECHQDKIENMEAISHGQEVDSRTPFGQMLIRCI